jgi:hypothetical protein
MVEFYYTEDFLTCEIKLAKRFSKMEACDNYLFKQRCPNSIQVNGKDIAFTDYDSLFF